MSVLLGQEKGRKCVSHHSFCSLTPFSSIPTHKHICVQPYFNPSLTECKPSQPALCDDVAFFPPQGGCWGLRSPAGNPWHPSYPLPFVPWWGNLHLGGWLMRPVAWNQAPPPWPILCPEPPFSSNWSAMAKFPRLLTACRQHADSMISPFPFTSYHSAHMQIHTLQINPHILSIAWISITVELSMNNWSSYDHV